MEYEFREGDWVRHQSHPEPLRVIGSGATIAVRFPNGDMQAFEPCELQKVSRNPGRKAQIRAHRRGALFSPDLLETICLITLIVVVLVLIATFTL
jgi:hypothetical protein